MNEASITISLSFIVEIVITSKVFDFFNDTRSFIDIIRNFIKVVMKFHTSCTFVIFKIILIIFTQVNQLVGHFDGNELTQLF